MSEIERQYEYKPKLSTILLGALFFGVCAAVLWAKADSNDRGLIINGIIELGVEGATITYWIMTAFSVGFVVMSGVLLAIRIGSQQRVAFTRDSLIGPKSCWSKEEVSVDYRDITQLSTSEVSGQRFLTILHSDGKLTLVASMLPAKEDLDEICKELMSRVEAATKKTTKKKSKRAATGEAQE